MGEWFKNKLLLFLLIVIFLLTISSVFSSATSCSSSSQCPSNQDCVNGICCLKNGEAVSDSIPCCSGHSDMGVCTGSYCGNNIKESGEVCDGSDGCSAGYECKDDCSGCVASFSPNGVCEYGAGEQIGDSFYHGVDDCDQDNDKKYDSCDLQT